MRHQTATIRDEVSSVNDTTVLERNLRVTRNMLRSARLPFSAAEALVPYIANRVNLARYAAIVRAELKRREAKITIYMDAQAS